MAFIDTHICITNSALRNDLFIYFYSFCILRAGLWGSGSDSLCLWAGGKAFLDVHSGTCTPTLFFLFLTRAGRITKLSFRVSDMMEFVSRGKTLKRGSGRIRFLLRRLLPLWRMRPLEGDGHTWKTASAFFRGQNYTFCQRWLITTLFIISFLRSVSHIGHLGPVGVAEVIWFTH